MHAKRLTIAVVLASSSLAACGSGEGSSTSQAAPPSAQAALDAAPYVAVRSDAGTVYLARMGVRETQCPDGVTRPACAAEVDWSRLALSAKDEAYARARVEEGSALVFGKLSAGRGPSAGTFFLTELWTRRAAASTLVGSRAQTEGAFVLRDIHAGCTADVCPGFRAEPLDGSAALVVGALDLGLVGGGLQPDEARAALAGRLIAHGAGLEEKFVVTTIYLPFPEFGVQPSAPN